MLDSDSISPFVHAGVLAARSVLLLLLPLSLLTNPRVAGAQVIQGQLLDVETGLPVEGALALLLDEVGGRNDGYLTNAQGRFLLRAPVPGLWRVRVERIGYETVTSEAVELSRDQTFNLRMVVTKAPIVMEELRVEGSRRCVVRPGEGMALASLWEEARKVLSNQDWTSRERVYPFRISRFVRHLDASGRVVRAESRDLRTVVGATAIRSRSAGELMTRGFVQPLGESRRDFEYFGPDATVLMSDEFLDTHCLRLALEEDSERVVGVSFQPVQGRDVPDIRGTLWLDPETGGLRFLEYTYTWAPHPEARGAAKGRIDFAVLPSGAWIIRSWWIRTPKLEVVSYSGRNLTGGRADITGYVEEGEEITRMTAEGEERGVHPRGSVRGVVWDSILQAPLPDATVYLSGTPYSALTNPSGRFVLDDVPEGVYTAAFTHPGLDSLGFYPEGREVSILAGEVAEVAFALPPRASLLEAFCRGSGWDDARAAVVGTLRRREGGEPLAGARVEVTWTDHEVLAGRVIQPIPRSLVTSTDGDGRYRVCGISPGAVITALATHEGVEGVPLQFEVAAETIGVADLVLEEPGGGPGEAPVAAGREAGAAQGCSPEEAMPGSGRVSGRVVDAGTRVPLGRVQVWLSSEETGESRVVEADGGGRFLFCGLEPGPYGVRAVFRGFGEAREEVTVGADGHTRTDLSLVLSDPMRRTGILKGKVVGAESGEPIPGATVSLGEEGRFGTRVSRDDGTFEFPSVPSGAVSVTATMLGYADSRGGVALGGGQTLEVEIQLSPDPIEMEPIVVEAARLEMGGLLADVRRRADWGWGTVLMSEELEQRRTVTRTTEILREFGAELVTNERSPALYFRRSLCAPTVYIDGIRVAKGSGTKPPLGGGGGEESARAVDLIHPSNVEAMEIYRGPGEIPGEFLDSNAQCGVILIWTKRGGGIP